MYSLSKSITRYVWIMIVLLVLYFFFFFNDTATTEIYTLSLHDALPICSCSASSSCRATRRRRCSSSARAAGSSTRDRKSTRLNSSHSQISYAVFCLKKKKISNIAAQLIHYEYSSIDVVH